ncbi:AAA family ATPase [Agromyces sp. MMS24-JH15]|uniref:AAA family ATPase n=1 Tax=Agromyces sp. MMS24-JH15 TaxID=3243765 RepID=UPI003749B52C
MRIVVSGTHASGKSTLISDFALRHPEYTVLPDPFDLVDETWDSPTAASFAAQLRLSANRLDPDEAPGNVIAERGPLDFLAYLSALDDLTGASISRELLERATAITRAALDHVDLLVVLPLTAVDHIEPGIDEHLELRAAMNDVLLELIDDPEVVGEHAEVVEILAIERGDSPLWRRWPPGRPPTEAGSRSDPEGGVGARKRADPGGRAGEVSAPSPARSRRRRTRRARARPPRCRGNCR